MDRATEENIAKIMTYIDPDFYYKQQHVIDKLKRQNTYYSKRQLERFLTSAGRVCLMDKKSKKFPSGMITPVMIELEAYDKEFELIDTFERPEEQLDITISSKFELYDNQQVAFDSMRKLDFRCILDAATAFGKTHIGLGVINETKVPALIVVPTITIRDQWIEKMNELFPDLIGKKMSSACMFYKGDIPVVLISTVQLLVSIFKDDTINVKTRERNLLLQKFLLKSVGLMIYDEVHLAASESGKFILSTVPAYYRIGLTGSFGTREDNKDLEYIALIGERATYIRPSDLIEIERAVKLNIKFVETPQVYFSRRVNYANVYRASIINNYLRNEGVLEESDKLIDEGRQVLILVDRIEHAKILSEMGGYEWTDSSDNDRQDKFKRFRSGDMPILICTVKLAGIGFDMPPLSGLIIAGSGKSTNKFVQALGRVMRVSEGKSEAIVIDFADNCKYLREHAIERLRIYKKEPLYEVDVGKTFLKHIKR